ncbi:MAG TPA: hypothetical protein VMB50_20650 [Myxococcales bacterium]|nr:hypothetical protein [Myxococcales bacterium]
MDAVRDASGKLVTHGAITHGEAAHGHRTPEWCAWREMRYRCQTPTARAYPQYGGRGIKVCERWQVFENFLADMGRRPSPRHSLDRIDNDGNYEPGNCRWATSLEQNRNRRTPRGEHHHQAKLSAAKVAEIRGLAGTLSHRAIAARFGVSKTTVAYILRGKIWRAA